MNLPWQGISTAKMAAQGVILADQFSIMRNSSQNFEPALTWLKENRSTVLLHSCNGFCSFVIVYEKALTMSDDSRGTLLPRDSAEFTSLPAGQRQLGPYRLLRELGRGAMGTVYEAEHVKLKRSVALKVLPEELAASADLYARFQREMEAIGRLEHPNIVLATDAGQFDGVCFIAMQLIEGVDLSKIIEERGRLSVAEACEIVRQVALGLNEIQMHGMIHRDIKPSNLLLASNGEVKILDLGIASLRHTSEVSDSLTRTGGFLGTPDYIAPEQIINQGPIDIRVDIYSLGCTFYHLLSGQAPFAGSQYNSFPAKLLGHAEHAPETLSNLGVTVPSEVTTVLNRMLAKDREHRFETPAAVAAALEPFCDAKSVDDLAAAYGTSSKVRGKGVVKRSDRGQDSTGWKLPKRHWTLPGALAVGTASMIFAIAAWSGLSAYHKNSVVQTASQQSLLAHQRRTSDKQTEASIKISADVERLQTSGTAIAENTNSIAEATKELHETVVEISQSNQTVADNTEKIALTLEQMQADFSRMLTHLNEDPQTPSEWYANAILYAQSGNSLKSRKAYLKFFSFDLNVIDPFQNFASSLRLLEGVAGAREVFSKIPGDRTLPARRLVEISLQPSELRRELLQTLISEQSEFGPAYYALSETYGAGDDLETSLSLHDKFAKKKALESYLSAYENGHVLRHYLDQSQVKFALEPAERTLNNFRGVTQELLDNPLQLDAHYLVDHFLVTIHFADGAQNAGYRLTTADEFIPIAPPPKVPAGLLSSIAGAHTEQILAKQKLITVAQIKLPGSVSKSLIEVKYDDLNAVPRGPFHLEFNPEPIKLENAFHFLRARGGNDNGGFASNDWVEIKAGWSADEPTEIWFTGLLTLSWRAVKEIRYGVNSETPNRNLTVPRGEYGSETQSQFYTTVSESVRFVTLQVTFVDGQTTPILRYEASQ